MADKFLDELEKEGILEEFYKMELSQMIMRRAKEDNKLQIAKNLLDLLDADTIAERIGLPLETVLQLKNEALQEEHV